MNGLMRIVTMVLIIGFWTAPFSFSSPDVKPGAGSPGTFKGELLRIEGDYLVVKDIMGKETRVHVGQDTTMFGKTKAGDRLELWVQPDGHAKSVVIIEKSIPSR